MCVRVHVYFREKIKICFLTQLSDLGTLPFDYIYLFHVFFCKVRVRTSVQCPCVCPLCLKGFSWVTQDARFHVMSSWQQVVFGAANFTSDGGSCYVHAMWLRMASLLAMALL